MPDTILRVLRPDQIDEYEPRLRVTIENVAARSSGRYTAENILEFARRGIWQIWLVTEGDEVVFVGGTEVLVFPSGLDGFAIRFGTGHGRKQWEHHMDTVLAWGKARACGRPTLVEGAFRKGWGRVLPGWTHSHDLLERVI